MGGPQSPDEDRENFPYYDPKAELAFMKEAIAADIYIVGVCLGAQLLSVAYGAKYEHSPEREIGVLSCDIDDARSNRSSCQLVRKKHRNRPLAW